MRVGTRDISFEPLGWHRVLGAKAPRTTCWYEVCARDQVPESVIRSGFVKGTHCVPLAGGMQIFLRTLTGEKVPINLEPGDTVETLKERVEEKLGIPPTKMRLVYGGRQMRDDRTLKEHNLIAGGVVHLVLALRG